MTDCSSDTVYCPRRDLLHVTFYKYDIFTLDSYTPCIACIDWIPTLPVCIACTDWTPTLPILPVLIGLLHSLYCLY